jgi:hypothetical protein
MRYLYHTFDRKLIFHRKRAGDPDEYPMYVEADASFQGSLASSANDQGGVVLYGNRTAIWHESKKLTVKTLSTKGSEMANYAKALKDAKKMNGVRLAFGLDQSLRNQVIDMRGDSENAIKALAYYPPVDGQKKKADVLMLMKAVHSGKVRMTHVPGKNLSADLLTKPLNREKTEQFTQAMGLTSIRDGQHYKNKDTYKKSY